VPFISGLASLVELPKSITGGSLTTIEEPASTQSPVALPGAFMTT
jgi:hypothetical protein